MLPLLAAKWRGVLFSSFLKSKCSTFNLIFFLSSFSSWRGSLSLAVHAPSCSSTDSSIVTVGAARCKCSAKRVTISWKSGRIILNSIHRINRNFYKSTYIMNVNFTGTCTIVYISELPTQSINIGCTDREQIRSRINNNWCRTFWPSLCQLRTKRLRGQNVLHQWLLILLHICSRSVHTISTT